MKAYLTLDTIRKKVRQLEKAIGAPKGYGPTFGRGSDFGYPRIAVDSAGYHYIVEERGQELEHRTTQDIDELLYWIFRSITFEMASRHELVHRVPGTDSRRLLFKKQVELMGRLGPAFSARLEKEIEAIMKKYPYEDDADSGGEDKARKPQAKRRRTAEKLEVPGDLRFLWSDAWLLQAIYYASREAPAALAMVIGAADFINHAIMTFDELSGGLARLERAGLIAVDICEWKVVCSDKAKAYLRTREQLRYVHDMGREIERWLDASPYAPVKPARHPADDLRYPGLSEETFDAAVAEYIGGFKNISRTGETMQNS